MSKGNSCIGAYKNTSGAQKCQTKSLISKDILRHSTVGDFKQVGNDKWIMTGGGHSQESIDFMNKNNIGYEINIIYENGVRVGNVFCNTNKQKANHNGQAWFPENWSKEKIDEAGNIVAKKTLKKGKKNGKFFGEVDGVIVGVILKNGIPGTVFPDSKQQGVKK